MDYSFEREHTIMQEDYIVLALYFISFINSTVALAFLAALMIYSIKGPQNAVKALILITFRGVMSSAVASSMGSSLFKWIAIFWASFFAYNYQVVDNATRGILRNIVKWIFVFAFSALLSSLVVSSYPTTAVFKIISFIFPLIAVLKGVSITKEYRWADYLSFLLALFFLISAVLVPYGRFRIVNSNFQGIFNHVNMLGIMTPVFIASIYSSSFYEKRKLLCRLLIGLSFVLCFLSASRTGMFTSIAVVLSRILFSNKSTKAKVYTTVASIVLGSLVYYLFSGDQILSYNNAISRFVFKNNFDVGFLYSRESIINEARNRFENNRLLGTGFMVPYNLGSRSFSLLFDLVIEPGNIVWALLSYTGVIGTVCFSLMLIKIFKTGNANRLYLLIAAFMINMGEMVFFSTNNMSILLYVLIALYIFPNNEGWVDTN